MADIIDHLNETKRLAALREYAVVDTPPEKEYDDITRLAAWICNTSIALITFKDSARHVVKASYGLTDSESLKNENFYAVADRVRHGITVITHTENEKYFLHYPIIAEFPHIGFYAGVPLINPRGFLLGTLSVIDDTPRTLTNDQVSALKALSNQVITVLELRKKNLRLEQSYGLSVAKNTELEQFAYIASHDLKEPLRIISSFIALLEKGYVHSLDDTAKEYLHYISDGAKRMDSLINNLLAYSKVGTAQTQRQDTDVNKVLQDIVKMAQLIVEETNATIRWGDMPTFFTDDISLYQVFQNLILNALKYQAAGAKPVIHIEAMETDTHWQFSVADNGIGIAPQHYKRIFIIFQRLHAKEEYPGTGMGLAICKKIVEINQGTIWLESEKDKGSTFYFTFRKQDRL